MSTPTRPNAGSDSSDPRSTKKLADDWRQEPAADETPMSHVEALDCQNVDSDAPGSAVPSSDEAHVGAAMDHSPPSRSEPMTAVDDDSTNGQSALSAPRLTPAPSLTPEQRQQRIDWLIEQFHRIVFGYAIRLAGNQADAEDLTQHTFLTAQEKLEQLRDPAKSKSWLLTICRNRFLKECRRKRPIVASTRELTLEEIPEDVSPESQFDQEKLALVIDSMPDDHRVILMMFYFEELSYREIAEQLDVKIGTVMSRLSRAKGRLRELLLHDEDD